MVLYALSESINDCQIFFNLLEPSNISGHEENGLLPFSFRMAETTFRLVFIGVIFGFSWDSIKKNVLPRDKTRQTGTVYFYFRNEETFYTAQSDIFLGPTFSTFLQLSVLPRSLFVSCLHRLHTSLYTSIFDCPLLFLSSLSISLLSFFFPPLTSRFPFFHPKSFLLPLSLRIPAPRSLFSRFFMYRVNSR